MLADPHVRVPLLCTTQQPGLTVSRLCFVCRLRSTCSMLVAAAGSTSWRCSPLYHWHQTCVWLCGCVAVCLLVPGTTAAVVTAS